MNRIRQIREEIGMTQVRLSIELEVAQETISAYENGKHYPGISTLIKLMQIFHASMDYIMGYSDVRLPQTALTDDEQQVLGTYRALPERKKELVQAYLKGLGE